MEQRRICILSKNTIECANDKELDKLLQDSTTCNQRYTLKYEYPGRYYLIIPIIKKKQANNNMIAFDPGVKTFQTGFDSNSNYIEYGK